MTEQQITLVKKSWLFFRQIKPEVVADAFFSKRFMDNPNLRKMFPNDMKMQYEKLIDMLNIVVARLDRLDELTEDITEMGIRHREYGVKPEQYAMVGNALLWTLKNGLGDDWNNDVEKAWTACYTLLSDAMIAANKK